MNSELTAVCGTHRRSCDVPAAQPGDRGVRIVHTDGSLCSGQRFTLRRSWLADRATTYAELLAAREARYTRPDTMVASQRTQTERGWE